jgi:hypothetical protein
MYNKRNTNYQKILLEQEKKIFRTGDLGVLWEIENENSLWMTIQRYIKRKILYPVQRGMYSVLPLNKLDLLELGCAVSGPHSYISGETILVKEGIIQQQVNKITLFGQKAKEFELGGNSFLCRYLNPRFLMNRAGINDGKTFSVASGERALADLLRANPNYYVDNQLVIRKDKLKTMQREVGYL